MLDLALALIVAQTVSTAVLYDGKVPVDVRIGHYIGAIRDLREDVALPGEWGWAESGAGCAVVIKGTEHEVIYSRESATCSAVTLRSKVSLAALDALLLSLDTMDREDRRTLVFVRGVAQSLIAPLYPERWTTLRQAEDLAK